MINKEKLNIENLPIPMEVLSEDELNALEGGNLNGILDPVFSLLGGNILIDLGIKLGGQPPNGTPELPALPGSLGKLFGLFGIS